MTTPRFCGQDKICLSAFSLTLRGLFGGPSPFYWNVLKADSLPAGTTFSLRRLANPPSVFDSSLLFSTKASFILFSGPPKLFLFPLLRFFLLLFRTSPGGSRDILFFPGRLPAQLPLLFPLRNGVRGRGSLLFHKQDLHILIHLPRLGGVSPSFPEAVVT